MTTVQSVITPETNGSTPPNERINFQSAGATRKTKTSTKTKAMASTAMTADQAIAIAFESGDSFASIQERLSTALVTFKDNETVRADMLAAMNHGYLVRKLCYTMDEAIECMAKSKHSDNPKLQDDEHRTFEEQRVVDTVRVLWHRANKLAGTLPEKSENRIEAEQKRAAKEAEKQALESRLVKADEIVNPKTDTDPFDALSRLVLTMKSLQNKYSDKLTGDRGSAWRDWLANAPK